MVLIFSEHLSIKFTMFICLIISSYSATKLSPSQSKIQVVDEIKILGKQSWVDNRFSKSFKTIEELEKYLLTIVDPSTASKVIKRAPLSTLSKYHFVNFSASMTPSKQVRYFLRQNTLLRVSKDRNGYSFNSAVVNGRVTVNAFRRTYYPLKGWHYDWLPLPGSLVTDYYMQIQGIAQNTLSQTIKYF